MWKEIEKEGGPIQEGVYLTICKHINYPYCVAVHYFDGSAFVKSGVLPITHWAKMPPSPEEENDRLPGLCC